MNGKNCSAAANPKELSSRAALGVGHFLQIFCPTMALFLTRGWGIYTFPYNARGCLLTCLSVTPFCKLPLSKSFSSLIEAFSFSYSNIETFCDHVPTGNKDCWVSSSGSAPPFTPKFKKYFLQIYILGRNVHTNVGCPMSVLHWLGFYMCRYSILLSNMCTTALLNAKILLSRVQLQGQHTSLVKSVRGSVTSKHRKYLPQ